MDAAQWAAIDALIAERDPHCRGVVLLGLNAPRRHAREGLRRRARAARRAAALPSAARCSSSRRRSGSPARSTTRRSIGAIRANFETLIDAWRASRTIGMSDTVRLTMAQALVRYLAALRVDGDGRRVPLFGGVFAIFGHGNVAGIGEALYRAPRRAADVSRAQRAGDGACGDRVCEGEHAPPDDGVHDVDRAGRDEPRHRRGARARQPAAGAAAAGRHLRHARTRSGAAAGRGLPGRHRVGERLLSAGLALFRPHRASGATADRAAARDPRADRSRRCAGR